MGGGGAVLGKQSIKEYVSHCVNMFVLCFVLNRMPSKLRKLSGEDRVKNAQGTSGDNPPGSPETWQQYWEKHSGQQWPAQCTIHDCTKDAKLGGHVTINTGKTEYIFPISVTAAINTPTNPP